MIKVLYEAGHRPDKMGLLIDLSWIFLNGDMGPSNSLLGQIDPLDGWDCEIFSYKVAHWCVMMLVARCH